MSIADECTVTVCWIKTIVSEGEPKGWSWVGLLTGVVDMRHGKQFHSQDIASSS